MTFSRIVTQFLVLSTLAIGASAMATETKLNCEGFGDIEAAVNSELNLTSLSLKANSSTHTPEAESDSSQGRSYREFDSGDALGIDTAAGSPIPGKIIAFAVGDQTTWGYELIMPAKFLDTAPGTEFKASLFEYEPREIGDGGSYHDLQCTLSKRD